MSDYKCIKTFLSISGRNYNYGSEISTIVYYNLQPSERRNFTKIHNDDSRSSSGSSNDSSWLNTDYGSGSSWSSDSSSDSSSSDFGGFGGGDTGGGGASGDW